MFVRVIALGNPGSGKSTILNTLINAPFFASGTSPGHGILPGEGRTEYISGDTVYVDTPGLADPAMTEHCASYISHCLSQGGVVKLLFVLKIEDMRVNHQDVRSMNCILRSLAVAGCEVVNNFTVVLNQLFEEELNLFETGSFEAHSVATAICSEYETQFFSLVPLDMRSKGKSGAVLPFRHQLLQDVQIAPTLNICLEVGLSPWLYQNQIAEAENRVQQNELAIQDQQRRYDELIELHGQEKRRAEERRIAAEELARIEQRRIADEERAELAQLENEKIVLEERQAALRYYRAKHERRKQKAQAVGAAAVGMALGFLF